MLQKLTGVSHTNRPAIVAAMAIKADTSFSLADQLFNAESVSTLADAIATAWPEFDPEKFTRKSLASFPDLELKQRINHMVDQLDEQLPADFDPAVDLLESALPAPLDPSLTDDDFGQFIWSVPAEWVAQNGCTDDRLDRSLAFLKQATMRFTVESAIRPFLNRFPESTLRFIRDCATDSNYHVRRLASEGIRPYLPWAQRVRLPIDSVVEVLTILHADRTRYVTRSVANTMNDLSRDDPELVIKVLKRWHRSNTQVQDELDWMTRHALRTLIKADNRQALELLGYPAEPKFTLSGVSASETVAIGDALHWRGTLKSKTRQKLKVGLRVHFLRANGDHSVKVFAVKEMDATKESFLIENKIYINTITKPTQYLGTHHVELVVNGKIRGKRAFELIES
ncbi:MAG: DNA alkylation repair protein [Pseudomonadota bacterium]